MISALIGQSVKKNDPGPYRFSCNRGKYESQQSTFNNARQQKGEKKRGGVKEDKNSQHGPDKGSSDF
jgi:hypothetical protein